MKSGIVTRELVGTGAAQNVELGFFPDYVKVINLSDNDRIYEGPVNTWLTFNSGGNDELKAGMQIEGDTSGAKAVLKTVIVQSGSWAGGNAAGYLVLENEERSGTFGNAETLRVAPQKGADGTGDWATTGATANLVTGSTIGAAVGVAAANERVTRWEGTTPDKPKGVTLGSTVSEDNKALYLIAYSSFTG